jgi:hypothetical protein
VPAYVVRYDATIDGIATARPTMSAQLRGIPGIGDKKLEHDGEEPIALVKAGREGGRRRGDRISPSKKATRIAMVQRNAGSFQNVRYFPTE